MNGEDFLEQVAAYVKRRMTDEGSANKTVRLALVDSEYDPTDFLGGIMPRVLFDGEGTVSQKRYTVIPPYYPKPGDRVALVPVGTTYVIMGSVNPVISQPKVDVFTADGTWTKPDGARYVKIECQAGGGGGGGGGATAAGQSSMGAGGGGGAYGMRMLTANTVGATEAVFVAAGGAGGVGVATGSAGGVSSFGALLSASGGNGGGSSAVATGTGGTFGGDGSVTTDQADITFGGSGGGTAWRDGNRCVAGAGGGSHLGGGAAGQHTSGNQSIAGKAGRIYGGGGSGAAVSDGGAQNTGGAGAAGVVIVTTYFT